MDREVLDGVTLTLAEGEVLGLIGASGSGKTTLIRCINSLEEYDGGEISLDGETLGYRGCGARRKRLGDGQLSSQRARIGMVFQSFNLFPHLSVEQNITLGLTRVLKKPRLEARDIAREWLRRVGLEQRRADYPARLSGGQQQRVAIARAFAMEPRVVLLDEVTSALDPELVEEVLAVLGQLARDGTAMIIVSHELAFIRDVATRVAFMHNGRIAEIGAPDTVFNQPSHPNLRNFVSRFKRTVG